MAVATQSLCFYFLEQKLHGEALNQTMNLTILQAAPVRLDNRLPVNALMQYAPRAGLEPRTCLLVITSGASQMHPKQVIV